MCPGPSACYVVGLMKIREVMTPDAQCVGPDETLVDAASLMRQLDVGVLPVCDDEEVVGMLTDRDIAIRAVAEGRDAASTRVRDIMSPGTIVVYEDQEIEEAVHVLEQHQIRRAPVMNRQQKLVGIISLGDIAVDASAALSGEALKHVSQPAEPVR
jgi:CBS domain-containing protein